MTQSICIFGRQPSLGLAELESLYGKAAVHPLGSKAALLDIDPCVVAFKRLGGSVKLAKLLTILDTTHWKDIELFGNIEIPKHVMNVPPGKFKLGLSCYDMKVSAKRLNATALSIKKSIKKTGRNVRIVPNITNDLSSAQVLHNQLTSSTGWELLFIQSESKTYVAQTIVVQDIDSYAARDQARPKRDSRVGMLPPKLAQIIINLATGEIPISKVNGDNKVCFEPNIGVQDNTILDPFCGTGVILQEATLMGYKSYGTDMNERMVEYSKYNLDWFTQNMADNPEYTLEIGDATETVWSKKFDFVASETYLGRPFSVTPSTSVLDTVIRDVNTITYKFLQNLAKQTKSGFRACIALPTWKTSNGFKHLPVLDQLTDMGYTRKSFIYSSYNELIYHRENQVVGRELVVLIRN